jgi:DNA-binding NarL/FixJ family response regulator
MKIVIVEDELLFRDVLLKVCAKDLGHEILGVASTGREALQIVPAASPDLLILDLRLPDAHGLDILASLRRKQALLRTLVISVTCDEYTVFRVERAAVQGFLDKSTNTVSELRVAIAAIERGSTHFSPVYQTAKLARSRDPLAFDKVLTPREQTVMALLGEPMSDAEIAARLGLSPETIEKHRFNIMRKLSLGSRVEMARYARRCGLTRAYSQA